jgi:nucleoside-diphosphate-sugar epimerase
MNNSSKKILVLGGTGAMGVYLVPELIESGYKVDVVSLDSVKSNNPNLTYIQANAMDDVYLGKLLSSGYDGIVDFMLYGGKEPFRKRHEILLSSTSHYIFLSSYRVYADSDIITENSPQLLDVSKDEEYLSRKESEYSLYKALQEDILENSKHGNWTIIRPAITYSKFRFQLVTLEAPVIIYRARNNKTVVLPKEAMSVQATMTWAGDVAKMISRLILNPKTYRESYTVATAEHNSWGDIAGYYKELVGLEVVTVDIDTYYKIRCGGDPGYLPYAKYQLQYDRLFNRVIDNSNILNATGLKQSDFMPLKAGLKRELSALPPDHSWGPTGINDRMDEFLLKEE